MLIPSIAKLTKRIQEKDWNEAWNKRKAAWRNKKAASNKAVCSM
jgi:hypothetical protein